MLGPIVRTVSLALVFAAVLAAPGDATGRRLLVLNAGNEPIFHLRAGHAALGAWGPDALGFAQIVEVSRGREVSFDVDPGTCRYDVEAVYGDGETVVLANVDLCRADRLEFDH